MVLSMYPYLLQHRQQELDAAGDQERNLRTCYDLFAVIIHRGSTAQFGHYHAYIKDVTHQHQAAAVTGEVTAEDGDAETLEGFNPVFEGWYDFDDSTVSPIPTSKLIKQFGGSSECACS
jgi:ubiquitin C-terminal hydrolase